MKRVAVTIGYGARERAFAGRAMRFVYSQKIAAVAMNAVWNVALFALAPSHVVAIAVVVHPVAALT
jgi:hypothetical protein